MYMYTYICNNFNFSNIFRGINLREIMKSFHTKRCASAIPPKSFFATHSYFLVGLASKLFSHSTAHPRPQADREVVWGKQKAVECVYAPKAFEPSASSSSARVSVRQSVSQSVKPARP